MSIKTEILAIKVHQWLAEWDTVTFDKKDNRAKPKPDFLMFTIKAGVLKKLSKVYPRRADDKRDIEIGIQRKHDPERSEEIGKYVEYGYPLSDLVRRNKIPEGMEDLQMPGWLPTAIVANIITTKTVRGSETINQEDTIKVSESGNFVTLTLPSKINDPKWNPTVPPIEIIDGQHRLWAFQQNTNIANEFELPVVAFLDLDITWQAYLFYTINVKPKKINRSLAYDLYPLLRIQEWLERSPETAHVYKETRAQEIVEVLWSYKKSPWKERINMLGDTQKTIEIGKDVPNITQAAYIRNLIASFIKTTVSKGLGGLYGAKLLDDYNTPLGWNRTQQVSFIIFIWQKMYSSIEAAKLPWATSLRKSTKPMQSSLHKYSTGYDDLAFTSKHSLISSDQGVRGFLHVINDMVFTQAESLGVRNINWNADNEKITESGVSPSDVDKAIKDLSKSSLNQFVTNICEELVKFDWRTSSETSLSEEQRRTQMLFKGSSGYKVLRTELLRLLSSSKNRTLKETSLKVLNELGYANN